MPKQGTHCTPRRGRRINDRLRDRIREALPQVLDVVLQAALAGDMAACKLLLAKALPDLKPEADAQALPELLSRDPRRELVALMASGDVSPEVALKVIAVMSAEDESGYRFVRPPPTAAELRAKAAQDAASGMLEIVF